MSVNVLIVGGGSIGERHLRCFQQVLQEGTVALCELDPAKRAALGERYRVDTLFETPADAIGTQWDAVVICTPAHLHLAHATEFVNCTRSLLIEKPLATTTAGLAEFRRSLQGQIIAVAYVQRVHPAVEQARRLLRDGAIGELREVVIAGGQHFPTFRPAYREIYYARRETGGGAVQDAATHLVDLATLFAGRFDWVFCDYAHLALEGVAVEDTVHLVGRAANESVLVSIALNQFMAPNETVVQLNGTAGSLQIQLHAHRLGIIHQGEESWQFGAPLIAERDELFRRQAQRFLAAAAGTAAVPCSLEEAEHVLCISLAALASAGVRRVAVEPHDATAESAGAATSAPAPR